MGTAQPDAPAPNLERAAWIWSSEQAIVETHIHVVRADGAGGQVLLGANRGPIAYDRRSGAEDEAQWLRNFGFGSPAPLPDGRVACISDRGLVVSPLAGGSGQRRGTADPTPLPVDWDLFDVSPLPDGRLLCSKPG